MTRGQLNRRCASALCAAIVGAATAGCGGGGQTHRAISLSVLAPTDGATVSIRSLVVVGTVSPHNAIVSVSGRRVNVERGAFRQPLTLNGSVSHITVSATASGYAQSTIPITVHYSTPAGVSATQQTTSTASGYYPAASSPAVTTRADKLCAKRNTAVSAQTITSTTLATALGQAGSLTGALIQGLRSLADTSSSSSRLHQLASGLEAEAADAAKISTDLSAGQSSSAQGLLAQEQVLGRAAYGEATALKLPECGEAALMIGPSGAEIEQLDSQALGHAVQRAKSQLKQQSQLATSQLKQQFQRATSQLKQELQRARSQLAHALQQAKSQKAAHSSK